MTLPDLSRYDRIAFDTETTGLTTQARPTGLSLHAPDGQSWYLAWGHGDAAGLRGPPSMNNCSLPEVVRWAGTEMTRPGVRRVAHNAAFDLRMLAYVGIFPTGVHDTQVAAAILNENRSSFSLNELAAEAGLGVKADEELHTWMAAHLTDDKNRPLKPTRRACAPHYWRVPHHIMAPYAKHDAVLTDGLDRYFAPLIFRGDKLGTLQPIYDLEIALQPMLLRMHLHGVYVNRERAKRLVGELTEKHGVLEEQWRRDYGSANYRSPDDLQPIFDDLKIVYPLTPKTKKASLTSKFLEGLDHPIGEQIRSLRKLSHYRDTFITGYILNNTTDEDECIRGEFHPLKTGSYGTVSGRFSSGGDLNLQNLPARDEVWAPLVRSVFRPVSAEHDWLKIDYSQIEYRFFAHYAGLLAQRKGRTSAMETAYINDPTIDFHDWVATTADIKRKRAKNVNFCRLYGGGIAKIALTAGCSYEEAEAFVAKYDEHIPEARELMNDLSAVAARRGVIVTWAGRRIHHMTEAQAAAKYAKKNEQPRRTRNPNAFAFTHKALNELLQGSAADLIKRAMLAIDREKVVDYDETWLHLTVHDELDFSIMKGAKGMQTAKQLQSLMQDVAKTPSWDGRVMRVPVIAEMDIGPNWGMVAA